MVVNIYKARSDVGGSVLSPLQDMLAKEASMRDLWDLARNVALRRKSIGSKEGFPLCTVDFF